MSPSASVLDDPDAGRTNSGRSAPGPVDPLRRVAANLRWSWHRASADLVESLPGPAGRHPVMAVDELLADPPALDRWRREHGGALAELVAELDRLEHRHPDPAVAYFCPEFGIAAELPQYSGGLGILAGDHLKAASDLALPLVGVGLFYHEGFFRQAIVDGRQAERIETVVPRSVGATDTGVIVEVDVDGESVAVRVWELWVGATRLLLLDTDLDDNPAPARAITNRLYAGDRRHRLSQELVLGIGGVRALRALGVTPAAFHLNEGHACFLLIELLAELVAAGRSLDAAIDEVRAATLFTTHTPVPAGIDRFERPLIEPELAPLAERLGTSIDTILEWATLPSDGDEPPFNTAALAIALCGRINGVSQLHASVSRELFADLPRAGGVEGITNGVHARTWVMRPLQDLYDASLGDGWEHGRSEAWAGVDRLDRDRFTAIRAVAKTELIARIDAAVGVRFDPDRCVIGFARRFATYKRAALLLQDRDGLAASLHAGAQFVFAGKAHPADDEGKAVLAELAAFAADAGSTGQIVILPDYDIDIARSLYAGTDVWLNNPIRPREACGTSGEKAALNGVLNCSILDGWWADWYTDGIGWVIPSSGAETAEERDAEEAVALHRVLTTEVLSTFDDDDRWWATVQRMLGHLGPRVTAGRMVAEYDDRFYTPIRSSR